MLRVIQLYTTYRFVSHIGGRKRTEVKSAEFIFKVTGLNKQWVSMNDPNIR